MATTLKDALAELAQIDADIASSQAFLLHATGSDRRAEKRHLAALYRKRTAFMHSLDPRQVSTTGEAGALVQAGVA